MELTNLGISAQTSCPHCLLTSWRAGSPFFLTFLITKLVTKLLSIIKEADKRENVFSKVGKKVEKIMCVIDY
jgi:hypothetical protein